MGIAALPLFSLPSFGGGPPARRAVVVGIGEYDPKLPPGVSPNLMAPPSDAEAIRSMLVTRYRFFPWDITVLTNQEATREAILSAIDERLVAPSRAGDVAFFYFTGHGSQLINPDATGPMHEVETIVPFGGRPLGRDIKDRELGYLFNNILDKQVQLTAVFDSCHSGAITRGLPQAGAVPMGLPAVEATQDLAPEILADKRPPPERRGAVILSASLPDQVAWGKLFCVSSCQNRGVLTWALVEAVYSSPANATGQEIYQGVKARVAAVMPLQEPVLNGPASRSFVGGQEGPGTDELRFVSSSVTSDSVAFFAGDAQGLSEGTALREITSACNPIELVISKVSGPGTCEAKFQGVGSHRGETGCSPRLMPEKPGASLDTLVPPGTAFTVTRWASPQSPALRVALPSPGPTGEWGERGSQIRQAARRAGWEWVVDPTEEPPSAVLEWSGEVWRLTSTRGELANLGPSLSAEMLKRSLEAARKKIPTGDAKPSLFWEAPVSAALSADLRAPSHLEEWRRAGIRIVPHAEAHYRLLGRWTDKGAEFAWVKTAVSGAQLVSGFPPDRSEWFPSAQPGISDRLAQRAVQLASLQRWLNLTPPAGTGRPPYKLRFREWGSDRKASSIPQPGKLVGDGDFLLEGYQYGFCLEPQVVPSKIPEKMYAYIVGIDANGRRTLLFPSEGYGNSETRVPSFAPKDSIPGCDGCKQLGTGPSFEVSAPLGEDLYLLLMVPEPVIDLASLSGGPIKRGAGGETPLSPFEQYLTDLKVRGGGGFTPTGWYIYRTVCMSRAPSGQERPSSRLK